MKKNLTFKIGLFCAALVLVATCFVTSAWAKYTKTVSATDSARVALFSVNVKEGSVDFTTPAAAEIDIFGTQLANIYKHDSTNNVSEDGKKLIAPGSKGEFVITFENTSEVAVRYTLAGGVNLEADVLPQLVWKIGSNEYETLEAALASVTVELKATDGSTTVSKDVTISWEWPFEGNDAADTEDGTTPFSITAVISATAVQISNTEAEIA